MLSERQKMILWAVIDDYILSAEPVGSRTVSKKEGIHFSAATVRNVMADLEEMGFLEQPHTSAGRVPSQKGYRFYVDHLLKPYMWSKKDLMALHDYYVTRMDHVEQAIKHTNSILSQLTNYMTFILGPKISESKLKHLQIVPLNDRTAVSILVTDTGHVYQQHITVPEGVSLSEIERLTNFLRFRLTGSPISKLKQIVVKELADELQRHVDHFEKLTDLLDQILQAQPDERLYTSGTTKILEQPEFRDVDKMKSLLDFLENDDEIISLLQTSSEGVQVRIGYENHLEAVRDCSIISASYMINGEPVGTIGVLGPTRMDYGRVIGIIQLLAKDFSRRLDSFFENGD
ncbi:heat-inducible transcription repressor HrcA [Thermoactinomyces intermedius]|jgi:heat-inducible transcriptional repressor|uniref:Heat-inducible transcription repressor HrcA n=1 Tax=Thermoactinomyces intermedius TaxID=2024 RepID=A0A8I1A1X7_THEIN|nr:MULTISPECIES: heat-inducible transcriptional repressor HrcA [Thermoactinomyces]MBA4547769.1 heat-inducible transcription repressor HrcA [Thermoactinomyces intermedius]MBA4836620.1 heat-inducible transcription repressor HrcA [Thermoactinomyces intermedius]MBH8594002.1 heat-inducible transcription repressor HrcA [Thermoactinomyces intermedius]MBH8600050.1 heat-inducible transcription repressor HrcA [Thermoactinomyces sp. CICC 23799]